MAWTMHIERSILHEWIRRRSNPHLPWHPERHALLRTELDAYFAQLYGLTRDELRYILDPADVHGPDFPSETFRVLEKNEMKQFGEYRTQRLVLEAWEKRPPAPLNKARLKGSIGDQHQACVSL
jgi:hypothetical protein